MWVAGEVARPHLSQRGHFYFELVEKGRGDSIVGKLDAVIWRSSFERIRSRLQASGQEIREGVDIRCRARLDFYPPGGRLQIVVDEVDPLFTLGLVERRRRETLAALEAAGLLERNASLELSEVPLRVGLVTAAESAAYHDFLAGLAESGYGFQVYFVHASVQGRAAEVEVPAALALLASMELDGVALVRGGGSRTDLLAFDSRAVAGAVARAPWPVLTGLGHETDQSITDLVSHTAAKTPTMVAEILVNRVADADLAVIACRDALLRSARERLKDAAVALGRHERLAQVARLRLGALSERLTHAGRTLQLVGGRRLAEARRRLDETARRFAAAAPHVLERRRDEPRRLAERIAGRAAGRLREAGAALDGIERLIQQLAPERTLERGFSITRDGDGGIVRDPAQVRAGETITSQLARGKLLSRVEET